MRLSIKNMKPDTPDIDDFIFGEDNHETNESEK